MEVNIKININRKELLKGLQLINKNTTRSKDYTKYNLLHEHNDNLSYKYITLNKAITTLSNNYIMYSLHNINLACLTEPIVLKLNMFNLENTIKNIKTNDITLSFCREIIKNPYIDGINGYYLTVASGKFTGKLLTQEVTGYTGLSYEDVDKVIKVKLSLLNTILSNTFSLVEKDEDRDELVNCWIYNKDNNIYCSGGSGACIQHSVINNDIVLYKDEPIAITVDTYQALKLLGGKEQDIIVYEYDNIYYFKSNSLIIRQPKVNLKFQFMLKTIFDKLTPNVLATIVTDSKEINSLPLKKYKYERRMFIRNKSDENSLDFKIDDTGNNELRSNIEFGNCLSVVDTFTETIMNIDLLMKLSKKYKNEQLIINIVDANKEGTYAFHIKVAGFEYLLMSMRK